MSRGLTIEQMEFLVGKGLTADEMLAFAKMGNTRSKGAERTARWRANKDKSVTSDVTGDVTGDASQPPIDNIIPPSVSDETGASADPVKELFDLGVEMLESQGHSEREARSLLGKWRKGRSPGDVVAALVDAKTRSVSNLVEWMPRRLNGSRSTGPPSFLEHYEQEVQQRKTAAAQ